MTDRQFILLVTIITLLAGFVLSLIYRDTVGIVYWGLLSVVFVLFYDRYAKAK